MKMLEKYKNIVGEKIVEQIYLEAEKLRGKHLLHINSTYQGGGVAEIMNSFIPMMNEAGIDTGWRILHATPDFFMITKKFNNALQEEKIHLTGMKKKLYMEAIKKFSSYTHIDHDYVMIHDPQPLALIDFYKKKQPWLWRCHSDLSKPEKKVFSYLSSFIKKYDAVIFSMPEFRQKLPIKQFIIPPAIDPLSTKNIELKENTIDKYLKKFGIEQDKPIIAQVSRFDKLKDHEGVVNVFKKIRKKVKCRLVLIGNIAMDDPEGQIIYNDLVKKTTGLKDFTLVSVANDILVNALQRRAAVIIQKSIKEGFGLTVTEALWKSTPVVASHIGGIKAQIMHGKNGFLLEPFDNAGFVKYTTKLLLDKKLRKKFGMNGKEHVRKNFLMTRYVLDEINLAQKFLCKNFKNF